MLYPHLQTVEKSKAYIQYIFRMIMSDEYYRHDQAITCGVGDNDEYRNVRKLSSLIEDGNLFN